MTDTASTRTRPKWPLIVAAIFPIISAVTLWFMGRVIWCKQGDLVPWSFDIWSAHNSQHILDPYTFTHILHGVLFYGILRVLFSDGATRRKFLPASWVAAFGDSLWFRCVTLSFGKRALTVRLMLAVVIESIWEVVENSAWIIEKYRESTISLDYNGDSVINSLADIAACVGGFFLAATLPAWASIAFFIVVELFLAWWIRDSLILNIVMLTVPLDVIKDWQSGNTP